MNTDVIATVRAIKLTEETLRNHHTKLAKLVRLDPKNQDGIQAIIALVVGDIKGPKGRPPGATVDRNKSVKERVRRSGKRQTVEFFARQVVRKKQPDPLAAVQELWVAGGYDWDERVEGFARTVIGKSENVEMAS